MKECLLSVDKNKKYVVFLGYMMDLTESEFSVLSTLYYCNEYMKAADIVKKAFAEKNITEGNIAVHICNINKKAMEIGGRKLIECRRFKGYKISDTI